jgi:hypothetical protein
MNQITQELYNVCGTYNSQFSANLNDKYNTILTEHRALLPKFGERGIRVFSFNPDDLHTGICTAASAFIVHAEDLNRNLTEHMRMLFNLREFITCILAALNGNNEIIIQRQEYILAAYNYILALLPKAIPGDVNARITFLKGLQGVLNKQHYINAHQTLLQTIDKIYAGFTLPQTQLVDMIESIGRVTPACVQYTRAGGGKKSRSRRSKATRKSRTLK